MCSKWMKIETAPKDGACVLIAIKHKPINAPHYYTIAYALYKADTMYKFYGMDGNAFIMPDYWQPLPEPPKE